MRVTIYDKNPGKGLGQWLLKTSWLVGCWLQKLLGLVDDYYGASSWQDAVGWLQRQSGLFTSIQYWGHGSPGCVWLAGQPMGVNDLLPLRYRVEPTSVLWFRTCSTLQGQGGYAFSERLTGALGCIVAGHTRIIGLFQGGLHTRTPNAAPSWPVDEGEYTGKLPAHLFPVGNNVIFCLRTRIPDGW